MDPNHHPTKLEAYLRRALGASAHFLGAERLPQSSHQAPWRLEVALGGAMRRYVLRLEAHGAGHEVAVLRAMESISLPTPRVYGWDPAGEALGAPCYPYDYVEGDSLLGPMLAGEPWAETLFLESAWAGVIDFENAGFSDPIYEFLLSFFVEPRLRGRGNEAPYCRRMNFDPAWLPWYHGLELFDTWRWVARHRAAL